MTPRFCAFCATVALLSVASCVPARAQVGTSRILSARPTESGETPLLTHATVGLIGLYGVDTIGQRTSSTLSTVFSLEHGVPLAPRKGFLQIGGFTYFKGGDYLYQLQAKYYFNKTYGVQVGYQNGSVSSNDFIAHALLNLSTRDHDPNAKTPLDFQAGAGFFAPEHGAKAFSGYVQASVGLSRKLSLDLSYWGVYPGHGGSVNRYLIGLGYNF